MVSCGLARRGNILIFVMFKPITQLMIDWIGSDFDNICHLGHVISPGNEDKRQK